MNVYRVMIQAWQSRGRGNQIVGVTHFRAMDPADVRRKLRNRPVWVKGDDFGRDEWDLLSIRKSKARNPDPIDDPNQGGIWVTIVQRFPSGKTVSDPPGIPPGRTVRDCMTP